jgi:small subunit ribosomal protein S20
MPIKVSAAKRLKVYHRRKIENLARKKALKNAVKAFEQAVAAKDKSAGQSLSQAIATIDKAAKTNIIHANKAGRLKSRLHKLAAVNKIQAVYAKTKQEHKTSTTASADTKTGSAKPKRARTKTTKKVASVKTKAKSKK